MNKIATEPMYRENETNSGEAINHSRCQLIADHNEWPNRIQQFVAFFLNSSIYDWIEIIEK